MKVDEYFEGLMKVFKKNAKEVLLNTFKIWAIIPFFIFLGYAFFLIIFGITEEGILKMFELGISASFEWWFAFFINAKRAIVEILLVFVIVLNYYFFQKL